MKKKAFVAATAIVTLLTVLFHSTASFNPALLLALYPGLMASLMVTGGHGGTLTQEKIGLALEFAVNLLVYGLIAMVVLRVARKAN